MAVVTQIPTPSEPLTRDKGLVTTPWFQFFMHVFNTVSPGGGPAPANTGYVVTSADPSLPNSRVATSSATVTVNVATPGVMKWDAVAGSGTGDVVGPASAVDDRIATYDGTTGKLIQDGGKTIATVVSDAVTAAVAAIIPVDLASEVTGDLPLANLAQASAASRLLGRGSAGGAGDWQEVTLGANLTLTGTVLAATGGSGTGDVVGPASAVDDRIATFDGTTGKLIQDGGATIAAVLAAAQTAALAALPATIGATFDGGSVPPTVGTVRYVLVPYDHTIQAVAMMAVPAGSAVVDVWRLAFGAALPTVADTITASAKPTLSSASTSADVTLTGWSITGTANDVYAFKLDSVSTITALQVQLVVART